MQTQRLGALDRGHVFIAADAEGAAHMYQVRDPAWTGPGEGNEVRARPVEPLDPSLLGLDIVAVGELDEGALFLLPETGGWHLYRVTRRDDESPVFTITADQLGAGGVALRKGYLDRESRVYARPTGAGAAAARR